MTLTRSCLVCLTYPSPLCPPSQVLVCVAALLYQNASATGLAGASGGITQILLIVIVCAIVYWAAALVSEIYTYTVEAAARQAAARGVRKNGVKGGRSASKLFSSQSRLEDGSKMEMSMSPMFISKDGGEQASLGSKESLVASILAQKEAPGAMMWSVFRCVERGRGWGVGASSLAQTRECTLVCRSPW